jgi:hypothetical protein
LTPTLALPVLNVHRAAPVLTHPVVVDLRVEADGMSPEKLVSLPPRP